MQRINGNILFDVPTIPNFLTTSNDYALVYTWTTEFIQTKVFQFAATSNSLDVKILGSVDNNRTCNIEVVSEFTVSTVTAEVKRVADYYTHLKVYVKPHLGGSHGTLASTASGNSSSGIMLSDIVVGTVEFSGDLPDTAASDIAAMRSDLDGIAEDTAKIQVGDSTKSASISVTPATDIPSTRAIGKVAISQAGGENHVEILDSSGNGITSTSNALDVNLKGNPNTIHEYNVVLSSSDTEYSQALPSNTKAIEFVSRGGYPIRYAFTTGKVAGPTAEYFVLKSNCGYFKDLINISSKTLYFATEDHPGDVVELVVWSWS
jgi:hypothetical protein